MNIPDPTPEETRQAKIKSRFNLGCGFILGLLFFGGAGIRLALSGIEQVEPYTWAALLLGIGAITWLAYKYGPEFWSLFTNY